ncbi:hypothetical protein DM02DRAFT_701187 [Periconia macrospinosa]|uniref:Uncharacterized protein n=1 Tax=Periconia macrospinosa TaxID=97972 RepID=A0A2V1DWW9_9PLEO|nr:hypothetical protein DM02DRAFT_701187 [Periconia macrospinosa]
MFLRTVFIFLAIAGAVLLHGPFAHFGGANAMSKHAKDGVFSNGKKLYPVYTGYPVIDDLLAMSVVFWDPVLYQERSTILLSRTFSASVQSLGVFAFIESQRRGCKNILLRWAPLNVFAWQMLGAAMFIPLYFMIELEQFVFSANEPRNSDPTVPLSRAKALLPATVITVLHLYRMVYFPPPTLASAQHQAFMAVWDLTPFLCYCVMAAIVTFFSPIAHYRDVPESASSRNADRPWVKGILALFGIFSAAIHIPILWELAVKGESKITHEAIFIPQLHKLGHPDTAASVFDAELRYFLQWDYIVVVIAAAVYITVIWKRINAESSKIQQVVVFLVATIASHIVSFGAVLAVILWMRENFLRNHIAVLERKGKKVAWS